MRWIVALLLATAPLQAAEAGSADRIDYVLLTGGDNAMMSGTADDIARARALQTGDAPLLYVRQQGSAYVIRDPAILSRAEAIMAPQRELGRQQGELGKQQGFIGHTQGSVGAAQGKVGSLMAEAPAGQQGRLGQRQGELGQTQAELGAQQAALGERQAELGRQQARAAELAQPQLRALIAEAIQRGIAQRVN